MTLAASVLVALGCLQAAKAEEDKKAAETVQKFKSTYNAATSDVARAEAVKVLGQMIHRKTMAQLAAILLNPGQPVPARVTAAEVLGTFRGVTGASKYLLAAALEREKKMTDVRRAACRALGELRAEDALPSLHSIMEEKPFDVAREAVIAAGKIRNRHSIPVLIEVLKKAEKTPEANEANPLGGIPGVGGYGAGGIPGAGKFPGLAGLGGMAVGGGVGGDDTRREQEERRMMLQDPTNKALATITGEKWTSGKEWTIWWGRNAASFAVQK